MSGPFLSSSWYRVARLHPALRGHVEVHVHRYQRKVWYILQDDLTGQSHRLPPAAYQFVAMMDGRKDLQTLWLEIVDRLGDAAPTQDDVIRLLSMLHGAELLHTEMPPDAQELFARFEKKERSKLVQILANPMSIKIPVWDPDVLLDRMIPYVRWVFSGWGLALWLFVVGRAGLLAAEHWQDLRGASTDHILAAENLVPLTIAFLVLKLIHEFGHGFAVKAYGGAVHELGIMLLILFPSPYVDASASIGFRQKWRRALVGAAGMLIEIFVAAIALEVWLTVEPGLLRAIAFNVMFVASVSTILFNGNPLLRYDGYYILTDVIEMPNLGSRATAYWAYLADQYLLGVPDLTSPATTRWERFWFATYAPASFVYRQIVMIGIALYIAKTYLLVGVIMAFWSLTSGVVVPIWKVVRGLLASPKYARTRSKTMGRAAIAGGGVLLCLLIIPFPAHTNSEGVVWLPESAVVRAATSGFVQRQNLPAGAMVNRDDELAFAEDPELDADIGRLRGRVDELHVQITIDRETDRVHQKLSEIELAQAEAELARQIDRREGLITRAHAAGRLVMAQPQELVGGFAKQGEVMAFVAPPSSPLVRATVDQEDIDLVRNHRRAVNVLLASDPNRTYSAKVIREVPAAQDELPSRALAADGGGTIATDPRDPAKTKPVRPVFQFELQLPPDAPTEALGGRVYVRFEHQWEPIAGQVWRRFRQMLLSRLEA